MSRRTIGFAMIGLGAVLVAAGILTLGGGSAAESSAESSTTTAAAAATATPTTAATTSTTTTSTTTTMAPPTTSETTTTTNATGPPTTVPTASLEDFAADYATATETDDVEFLFDHLYPAVRDAFGADVCRNWVETEIIAISDYRITGDITGPLATTLSVADTSIPVDQYYSAPISFTFQGQSFDGQASWVVEDGQVYWAGECR